MELFFQAEFYCLLMVLAVCGLLLAGFPVAFTLGGTGLLFAGIGTALGIFDLSLLAAFPLRIVRTMSNDVLVAVPLFVFMGVMLERSRVAEELLDNMGKLFGTLPGGLAYSVCIVGALLAASTGIVGATVVTMGLLSMPAMLKRGYDPRMAAGSIAASGTLGQIIPPSIVLVLLGDQLSSAYSQAQFDMGNFAPDAMTVNDLFAGALVPGIMLVGLYLVYQMLNAWLRPETMPAIPREEIDRERGTAFIVNLLSALAAPLLLIIAVLGSILGGLASSTEAASIGAVGAIMLAGYKISPSRSTPILLAALSAALLLLLTSMFDLRVQRNEISAVEWTAIAAAILLTLVLFWGIFLSVLRTFNRKTEEGLSVMVAVMRSTTRITSMVFVILIGAAMFSLVFRGFGGDELIENFLSDLPGGALGALLIVMAVMFLMGFFLDFLEITFIVVPIVAPILLTMEVAPGVPMDPVWLGVLMGINLQTSFLTPPFGFALFYLRGVAPPEVKTVDIYRGVIPFVIIQVIALALIWIFPELATWLPGELYKDEF